MVRLRSGIRSRALEGHPWILSHEIAKTPNKERSGQAVVGRGPKGELLGTGFYREGARVAWRRFRQDIGGFDPSYVREAFSTAVSRRKERPARRLVWSETDGLPGLVLDQYGKHLVAQVITEGMEKHWSMVSEIIQEALRPEGIWVRRDAPGRKQEGLEILPSHAIGNIPEEPVWVKIAGLDVPVDLRGGQKTGTYLDQQENYEMIASHAQGRRVLDLFCHNGGFSLRAVQAGAKDVTGVDSSQSSLTLGRQAGERHHLKVKWVEEDVSRFLRGERKGEYGLVILDPPGMVKGREAMEAGLRAMGELHRQTLRVLGPRGLLATFSCSHRVGRSELLEMVKRIAHEEKRGLRQVALLGQSSDHPIDLFFPESEYLTGLLLEVE